MSAISDYIFGDCWLVRNPYINSGIEQIRQVLLKDVIVYICFNH